MHAVLRSLHVSRDSILDNLKPSKDGVGVEDEWKELGTEGTFV